MPTYGSYETVREVFSTHGLTVYSARKSGTHADAEFAVKVFTPDLGMMVEAEAAGGSTEALDEFEQRSRRRLEVQQKASVGSRYVAPVIESGVANNEAWYVTRFYPRSVNRIVVGHVNLGKEGIHHVMTAIAHGALDIKRAAGRPHGGIHPTNIQVGKAEKIRDLEVVLSDPLDGSPAESDSMEKADLRAMGEVLYQLVRRRPLDEGSQWLILPIASSNEWTEMFGRDAEAWLRLCNRLLDPATPLTELSLEKLLGELAALTPKPAVSKTMMFGAAAALGLVVAGAILGYLRLSSGKVLVTVDPPEATIEAKPGTGGPVVSGTGKVEVKGGKGTRVTLTARYPGLPDATRDVTIEGGDTVEVKLAIPYGVVRIEARDQGSPIAANLVSTTITNKTPYQFYVGRDGPASSFTVFLDGHLPVDVKTSGRVGQTTNFLVNLVRAAPDEKPVAVVLESNPFGAEVVLDGQTNSLPYRQWLIDGRSYTAIARFQDWTPITNRFTASAQSARIAFAFPHGYVYFQCPNCPEGVAEVFVGERKITDTPKSLPWPVGETEFTFRRDGYDDGSKKIVVKDGERPTLSISLNPTVGFVHLETDPPGAIILDATDKQLGETGLGQPVTVTLKPGSYAFRARHKEFGTAGPTNVTVVKGRIIPVSLKFDYSELVLSSDPAGGEFLDPRTKQWQPMAGMGKLPLKPGPNSVKVRHPRLNEQDISLDLAKWALKEQRIEFPYASLVITSLPPEATIVIDGKDQKLSGGIWTVPVAPLTAVDYTLHYVTNGQTLSGIVRFIPSRRGSYTNGFNFIRREWRNSAGMDLVWVPKSDGNGGYWVGKHEVTRDQFKAIMETDPSQLPVNGGNAGTLPVDHVSAADALAFCQKLGERDALAKRLPDLGDGRANGKYDLPTEAEWAYFARTATTNNAVTSVGMTFTQSRKAPESVGSTGRPDGLGLYDVKGNVWELCRSTQAGQPFVQIGGGFNSISSQTLEGRGLGRKGVADASAPNVYTGFRVIFRP